MATGGVFLSWVLRLGFPSKHLSGGAPCKLIFLMYEYPPGQNNYIIISQTGESCNVIGIVNCGQNVDVCDYNDNRDLT